MSRKYNYPQEIKDRAIQLHNDGWSYNIISNILDISNGSIFAWCNPEKYKLRLLYGKQYRSNPENKEKQQNYRCNNKEQHNANNRAFYKKTKNLLKIKHKNRLNFDPIYKLIHYQRKYINMTIKNNHFKKTIKTHQYLGCSGRELKEHLERQFQPGMTWKNHAQFGWHVDHILPLSTFDLTDPEQQRIAFNYNNLQPLWWYDNLAKGGKKPIIQSNLLEKTK